MAKKPNLYHLWLGLAPELTRPNLFELLGVDADTTDDAEIKTMATASANSLLKKLKAVSTRNAAEEQIKQKLQTRIKLAYQTIVLPEKRAAYLSKLAATPNDHRSTRSSASEVIADLPPASSQQTAAEIPMAIPMAIPVTDPQSEPRAPSPVAPPAVSRSSLSYSQAADFDNLESEAVVKVVPRRKKTSQSWVVPLVVLVLIVGGMGGLISLLSRYNNLLELVSEIKQPVDSRDRDGFPSASDSVFNQSNVSSAKDSPAERSASPFSGSEMTSNSSKLTVPKTPKHAIKYDGTEDPEMELPDGGMPKLIDQADTALPPIASIGVRPESAKTVSPADPPSRLATAPSPASAQTDDQDNPFDISPTDTGRQLSPPQLNAVRLAHHRSRDALFRQDCSLARHFNNDTKKLLKRFNAQTPNAFVTQQRDLIQPAYEMEQLIRWVDAFWAQVKSSSIQKAGGLGVEIGDKIIGLVEGRDKDVVLRVAGKNRAIDYRKLTPMLALTLGNLGTIEDVPQWNLAKASYLAVMLPQYEHLKSEQDKLLQQLRSDGYSIECEVVTNYNQTRWQSLGLSEKKIPPIDDQQFEQQIASVRDSMNYGDAQTVSADRIDELIYRLTVEPQSKTLARVACLWETVALIERGQRVFDLMFVNRELTSWCTQVDFEKSFVAPVIAMEQAAETANQRDSIARQSLIFIKAFQNHASFTAELKQTLIDLIRKVAEENDDVQMAAMVNQIAREGIPNN